MSSMNMKLSLEGNARVRITFVSLWVLILTCVCFEGPIWASWGSLDHFSDLERVQRDACMLQTDWPPMVGYGNDISGTVSGQLLSRGITNCGNLITSCDKDELIVTITSSPIPTLIMKRGLACLELNRISFESSSDSTLIMTYTDRCGTDNQSTIKATCCNNGATIRDVSTSDDGPNPLDMNDTYYTENTTYPLALPTKHSGIFSGGSNTTCLNISDTIWIERLNHNRNLNTIGICTATIFPSLYRTPWSSFDIDAPGSGSRYLHLRSTTNSRGLIASFSMDEFTATVTMDVATSGAGLNPMDMNDTNRINNTTHPLAVQTNNSGTFSIGRNTTSTVILYITTVNAGRTIYKDFGTPRADAIYTSGTNGSAQPATVPVGSLNVSNKRFDRLSVFERSLWDTTVSTGRIKEFNNVFLVKGGKSATHLKFIELFFV